MADLAASRSGALVRAELQRLRSFDTTDVKCACKWRARRNGSGWRDVEAGGRRGAFSLTSVTDDAATDKRLLKRICGKRLESGRVFVRLEALGVAAKVQPQGGAPRASSFCQSQCFRFLSGRASSLWTSAAIFSWIYLDQSSLAKSKNIFFIEQNFQCRYSSCNVKINIQICFKKKKKQLLHCKIQAAFYRNYINISFIFFLFYFVFFLSLWLTTYCISLLVISESLHYLRETQCCLNFLPKVKH